eukprot:403375899
MEIPALDEEEMQIIYNWVDEIPLSRPKRNIARDFSDAVLVAEVVKHFLPHLVEIHNYSAAHSVSQKTYNWNTLNQKVFKKLGFTLTKKDIDDSVNCVPDIVERILMVLQNHVSYQHFYQFKFRSNFIKRKGKAKWALMEVRIDLCLYNFEFDIGSADLINDFNSGMNFGGPSSQQQQMQHNFMNNKENNKFMAPGFNQQQQQYPMTAGAMGQPDPRQQQKQMMLQNQVDNEILMEKEQTIVQMKETIEILELKIKKLEQLVKLKDAKISNLSNKLQTAGIIP